MCLTTNFKYAKTAKKDIRCYKILMKDIDYEHPNEIFTYKSPFHKTFYWSIGPTYQSLLRIRDAWPWSSPSSMEFYIEDGLHATLTYRKALKMCEKIDQNLYYGDYTLEICEMIIPKGSDYFIGKCGDISRNITANQMIFVGEAEKNIFKRIFKRK